MIASNLADRGKRLLAFIIDIVPITLIVFGVFYFFLGFDVTIENYLNRGDNIQPRIQFLWERNLIRNLSFLIWIGYCIIMESSKFQGTFGKVLMDIKVVDKHGNRLTFLKSIARNSSKLLSYVSILLGFIWILVDKKKQGWHDKLNHTFVTKTNKSS